MSGTLHGDLGTSILLISVRNILQRKDNPFLRLVGNTQRVFFYYWQLPVGQQNYKRNTLLRSGGNNSSADVPQCCFFCSVSLLRYSLKRASMKAISCWIVVCVHFWLWTNLCLKSKKSLSSSSSFSLLLLVLLFIVFLSFSYFSSKE
jgi:hypothetical protein